MWYVLEWRATYFGSLRVKLIYKLLGMSNEFDPSDPIQNVLHSNLHMIMDHAPKIYQTIEVWYAKPPTPNQMTCWMKEKIQWQRKVVMTRCNFTSGTIYICSTYRRKMTMPNYRALTWGLMWPTKYGLIDWRETYLVIPSVVVGVVDDRSTQTSGWVDSSSCNGDGCQVYQKHGEPNGKWSKHLAGVQGVTTRHQISSSSSTTTFKQHFNIRILPNVPNVAIYGNTRALN